MNTCLERAGPQRELAKALAEEVQWTCGWDGLAKFKVVGETFDLATEGKGARRMSVRRAWSSCLLGALTQLSRYLKFQGQIFAVAVLHVLP